MSTVVIHENTIVILSFEFLIFYFFLRSKNATKTPRHEVFYCFFKSNTINSINPTNSKNSVLGTPHSSLRINTFTHLRSNKVIPNT
jgi:hypothetical protein